MKAEMNMWLGGSINEHVVGVLISDSIDER